MNYNLIIFSLSWGLTLTWFLLLSTSSMRSLGIIMDNRICKSNPELLGCWGSNTKLVNGFGPKGPNRWTQLCLDDYRCIGWRRAGWSALSFCRKVLYLRWFRLGLSWDVSAKSCAPALQRNINYNEGSWSLPGPPFRTFPHHFASICLDPPKPRLINHGGPLGNPPWLGQWENHQ